MMITVHVVLIFDTLPSKELINRHLDLVVKYLISFLVLTKRLTHRSKSSRDRDLLYL